VKFLTLLAIALSLLAEDKPSIEQLQAQIAQQQQQNAEQAAELRLYQQGLFQCQAAEIHAQAKHQARPKEVKK
jgi:hypothetical protein